MDKDLKQIFVIALSISIICNIALVSAVFYTDSLPDFTSDSGVETIDDGDFRGEIDTVRKNTVTIYNTGEIQNSQGSAFLLENGYLVTNAHVVGDSSEVYVQFAQDQVVSGEIVGVDRYTDLAVIKPNEKPGNISGLSFAESATVGESVFAVGAPSGFESTATTGIISGTERSVQSLVPQYSIPDMVQVDSALNPGNSGGPIVNEDGEVVAVAQSRQGDNLGFGVSYRLTEKITQSLIEDGNHTHPFIGIRTLEVSPFVSESIEYLEPYEGVLVTETLEEGPASDGVFNTYTLSEEGKVEQRGDMIVEIKGTPIRDNSDLSRALLLNYEGGEEVTVTVVTPDGDRKEKQFTLGSRPEPEQTELSVQE